MAGPPMFNRVMTRAMRIGRAARLTLRAVPVNGPPETLGEAHARSPAEVALGRADVRVRVTNVAHGCGHGLDCEFSTEDCAQLSDELVNGPRLPGSDVVDAPTRSLRVRRGEIRVDDVVDEREVPRLLAVAADG